MLFFVPFCFVVRYADCNTNNIYINPEQEWLISYCRDKLDDTTYGKNTEGTPGNINISSILTGKLIAKISSDTPHHTQAALSYPPSVSVVNVINGSRHTRLDAVRASPPKRQRTQNGYITQLFPSSQTKKSEELMTDFAETEQEKKEALLASEAKTEALKDITSLYYNEERNEIYCGNRYGLIHVWGN